MDRDAFHSHEYRNRRFTANNTLVYFIPSQNLLRVVEASKQEARESSRSAQVEARLRQNLNSLRDERDKAITENAAIRRKLSLQEEELRLTKSKLSRVQQEKISIERDSR